MHNKMKLLESIHCEINNLIESEAERLTTKGQYQLYLLFKNCGYLKELIGDHGAEHMEITSVHASGKIDSTKTYFGG